MSTSVHTGFVNLYGKRFNFSRTALCAVAGPIVFSCANFRNDYEGLRSIGSEMSINFLSLSLDGPPPPHFVPRLTLSLFHKISQ
jgi:hypothetical protein